MALRPLTRWLRRRLGLTGRPKAGIIGSVDTACETFLRGWALDTADHERAVGIEVLHRGEIIASGITDIPREDVAKAGHGRLLTGFRLDLPPSASFAEGDTVEIRDAATGKPILGSPVRIDVNPNFVRFRDRLRSLPEAKVARFMRRHGRAEAPGISIVMPVYNTPPAWLEQAIASVRRQWHERWELVCVDDCSTTPETAEILARHAAEDRRITLLRTETNGGISKATNLGVVAAAYDIVAFMDHDDVLEPSALHAMAGAFLREEVDLAYSDEVVTDENTDHFLEFSARPALSFDYYLCHPYFVHFVACRKALIQAAGASTRACRSRRTWISSCGRWSGPGPSPICRSSSTAGGRISRAPATTSAIRSLPIPAGPCPDPWRGSIPAARWRRATPSTPTGSRGRTCRAGP
ncbi:glycosyltransferase [Methylobacterium komagatae]|uniref:Glycosyltransferase n=1 Tax=Methylobacterium komagatae TaxID=374425 RepID=A0ABW2BM70_9HYPH